MKQTKPKIQKVDTPFVGSWAWEEEQRKEQRKQGMPVKPLVSSLPRLPTECPPATFLCSLK